jgi:hypothetical protein
LIISLLYLGNPNLVSAVPSGGGSGSNFQQQHAPPERGAATAGSSMGSRSFKSMISGSGSGGSNGGRRSSASGASKIGAAAGHASSSLGSSSKGSIKVKHPPLPGGSMDSATAASLSSSIGKDTSISKQMNMFLRTKSDSGKRLSENVSYHPERRRH